MEPNPGSAATFYPDLPGLTVLKNMSTFPLTILFH